MRFLRFFASLAAVWLLAVSPAHASGLVDCDSSPDDPACATSSPSPAPEPEPSPSTESTVEPSTSPTPSVEPSSSACSVDSPCVVVLDGVPSSDLLDWLTGLGLAAAFGSFLAALHVVGSWRK